MLITEKSTRKKRSYFGIFSKFYSYLSLILLACILLLLLNTGYLNKYKDVFLYRLYKSSVNYYMDIFPIVFHALKGTFYTFPELNINISFNNVIKLENNRKDAINEPDPHSFNFLEVPSKIGYQNKLYKADLRLKGDRKIHFEERKYSSYKIDIKRLLCIYSDNLR